MSRATLARALRRHLVAGLVVIAPIWITAFVLWWLFQTLDRLLGRFVYPALGRAVPGLGLLLLVLLLLGVGWAAERAVGARVIGWWNALLERVPLARRLYAASQRVVRTVLGEERRLFRDVVLVEFPAQGRWSIGFLTAPAPGAVSDAVADPVTVFIPTTPNPTTGYLVIVPRAQVRRLAMSLEEAVTYVLSAGAVTPETPGPTPPPEPRAAP